MLRERPDIVVTTPESLYLLATAARGRELLASVDTVIVDEIHTIAHDKPGAHLALTLERVDRIVTASGRPRPIRIGCSATQRPIEAVARLLVGAGAGRDAPTVGRGARSSTSATGAALDVEIRLPSDELGAVMTNEQLSETVSMLAAEIRAHHTTLVFVNTRRMAERVAHLLAEELGEEMVTAHHGSLSMDRRLSVEARLREGLLARRRRHRLARTRYRRRPRRSRLPARFAARIATFLQRVGRADHRRHGIPKGRVFPFTRDELVECAALFGAVREGLLDAVHPPVAPLDILAQQIVAESAAAGAEGITENELATLVRAAAPYAHLPQKDLDAVLALVSDGVITGRGRRGAHVHRDQVNHVLRGRGAPASSPAPPAARSPSSPTTRSCSSLRGHSSAQCTRTSPSRPWPVTSSSSGAPPGGCCVSSWGRCASSTPRARHRRSPSGWERRPRAPRSSLTRSLSCAGW